MLKPHTFCHFCGTPYDHENWPRACGSCKGITWRNPIPVAVLLVQVRGGLLLAQRGIEPGRGKWALPGGFVEHGETWQQAAVRELREEVGVECSPDQIRFASTRNSSNGNMLIFGVTTVYKVGMPEDFVPNSETQAITIAQEPRELAFPTHTEMCKWFFHNKANHWLV